MVSIKAVANCPVKTTFSWMWLFWLTLVICFMFVPYVLSFHPTIHIISSENISFFSSLYCLVDYMFCFAFLMLLWGFQYADPLAAADGHSDLHLSTFAVNSVSLYTISFCPSLALILSYTSIPQVINTIVWYILCSHILCSLNSFTVCMEMVHVHI